MPVFTDVGEQAVVDILVANNTIKWIGWGTGATAEAKGNTGLTEPGEARVGTNAPTKVTVTTTGDTMQVIQTITASAARAITEVGLFTAVTAGVLVTRALFTVINLATGDSIEFTLQLQFT